MKHILALLLAVGVAYSQNPLNPAKTIVVGGNKHVSMGQVVAGYSNDFHIGIRIPMRTNVVSVNNDSWDSNKLLFPNPCEGRANFSSDVTSIEVVDLFGNRLDNAVDFGSRSINVVRGTYFISTVNTSGRRYSTILISK